MIRNHKIGSDVEFFLQNKKTKEVVSAEGIIKGTKYEPFHFDAGNKFFATSLDNVMAEGNIPPATSSVEFYEYVNRLMAHISESIPKELQLLSVPSARLDKKWLQTDNAQIFGCDPSLNCWTMEEVHPQPTGENVRSTGFHVHVGYTKPSEEANYQLARAMDLHLGLPAVLLEPKNERKTVGYGHAGNFRHQRHGMEYRSLSGFFASSEKLIKWCFDQAQEAIRFVNKGKVTSIIDLGGEIQRIINEEDRKSAQKMMDQFNLKIAA